MINKLTNFHVFILYFLNANLINTNTFSMLLVICLCLKHRYICIFIYTVEISLILCLNRMEQHKKWMIGQSLT